MLEKGILQAHLADKIANLCYEHFESLPKKGKPVPGKEWTILAAIVQCTQNESDADEITLRVVSMGTGSKCVGQGKLSDQGDLLHDSHAEVIARRAFLRYMYSQLSLAYTSSDMSIFTVDDSTQKCTLKSNVFFVFFSSHTPCGDASIIPKTGDIQSEELQPAFEAHHDGEDAEPPSKLPKLEKPDIHRTGAKCVEGGLQVTKT